MAHYLDKAAEIMVQAHAGQTDKAGQPYILHPLALAAQFDRPDYKAVAFLHDVVEDSNFTLADLREAGIPATIVEAVELLTFVGQKTDANYFNYIRKVRRNETARTVKRADLLHNLRPERLVKLLSLDSVNVDRYYKALRILDFVED